MQYRYYSKAAQMSADLKAVAHRVRTNKPDMFKQREFRESSMDKEGKVTVTLRKDSKATPLSPARRHALSTKRA